MVVERSETLLGPRTAKGGLKFNVNLASESIEGPSRGWLGVNGPSGLHCETSSLYQSGTHADSPDLKGVGSRLVQHWSFLTQ